MHLNGIAKRITALALGAARLRKFTVGINGLESTLDV